MCRFLVYKGKDEILLSKLILQPIHSILTQSYDCRLRLDKRRPHNGDGFGVGYYTHPQLGPEPCIFTSTIPAWNCINLERLASKTTSSLIFAHVRATTEGTLADSNCHPFRHKGLMWMHNGNIGGWKHVKRSLVNDLGDRWFLGVQGGTDSEWAFALYLDTLERMGCDPDSAEFSRNGFGHAVLRRAMFDTIARINKFIAEIPDHLTRSDPIDTRSLLNFAVADGHSVVCSRYVSSRTDEAASLFFSSGTDWKEYEPPGRYKMERRDRGADIVLVASEPLTFERGGSLGFSTCPSSSPILLWISLFLLPPPLAFLYSMFPIRCFIFSISSSPSPCLSLFHIPYPIFPTPHSLFLLCSSTSCPSPSLLPSSLSPSPSASPFSLLPPRSPEKTTPKTNDKLKKITGSPYQPTPS